MYKRDLNQLKIFVSKRENKEIIEKFYYSFCKRENKEGIKREKHQSTVSFNKVRAGTLVMDLW
jgi:hypothetical protein